MNLVNGLCKCKLQLYPIDTVYLLITGFKYLLAFHRNTLQVCSLVLDILTTNREREQKWRKMWNYFLLSSLIFIPYTLLLMNSMFTQHTTSNARLVPSVKLFTRCITAHCAHKMHYSQTNESNITLLIHRYTIVFWIMRIKIIYINEPFTRFI
jgi:hypothetical protein